MELRPAQDEVYQSPSELLEIARGIGAIPWKIAATGHARNKRSESAALGRQCELCKNRSFKVRIHDRDASVLFEAIGQGRTRKYRFTKC
jgi:hypothetical protein